VASAVVLSATLTFIAPGAHALTPLSTLRFSPDITVNFGGTLVTPQNVAQDNLAGAVSLVNIGAIPIGTGITGYHLLANGDQLLAFDTTVSLAGGVTARPGDVVRFNGATYTLEFDATAHGVPLGVMTDAVGVIGGSDLLLSFDTTVTLGAVTADKEDIVRFDGATFSMFFDASTAGVPPGVDLDAFEYLDSNGHLLLSFDTSGSVGGVAFDKEDVLEFDPIANTWQMAYDGSAQHAEWPPANLVALGLGGALPPPTPPPAGPPSDSDRDGIPDYLDNCRHVVNPDQKDTDADHIGDACDNCLNDFNFAQSDGNHNGSGDMCDSGTPTSFTLTRVRLKANRSSSADGTILVKGVLDTTELGGVDGLREAVGRGFAVGLTGAGLAAPEGMFFPPCRSVISCSGSGAEIASFVRRGATNLFSVQVRAYNRSFKPPLSSAPVTVTLSVGVDRRDQVSRCRTGGRRSSADCRK
jgi:hypothetical protein